MSKPLNHPDYEFAPGMFDFSKWSRENEPKPPPKWKLGDQVMLTLPLTVVRVGKDCDGSTLYSLSFDEGAHLEPDPMSYAVLKCIGEDCLTDAPKAEGRESER